MIGEAGVMHPLHSRMLAEKRRNLHRAFRMRTHPKRKRREASQHHPALERRRSEEHTSELQSLTNLVCRLLLEKKKKKQTETKHQKKSTTTCDMRTDR